MTEEHKDVFKPGKVVGIATSAMVTGGDAVEKLYMLDENGRVFVRVFHHKAAGFFASSDSSWGVVDIPDEIELDPAVKT